MNINTGVMSKGFSCDGGTLKKLSTTVLLVPVLLLLSACGEMNPQNVDVELEKSAPEEKITSYTQALLDLGLMSEIYDTGLMRVQSQDIADETGTSVTTGGEIQRNITEIMKSTLNYIGGNVIFIEYDPAYIQNQMVSGYSNFDDKVIPDVVITGGITEFDRGLETRGSGFNADVEAEFTGSPKWFPSETAGVSYGDTGKTGKARITLDFNLKDFQTLAGIPRMTTTNSMEVYKGLKEEELGITLFGPTFGLKGTIKKVQGRHEAVRVLVQASMIQMIGKYLTLPYWRLMGDDANPDQVVLDSISGTYYRMSSDDRVGAVQQWLILHGYDIPITGELDEDTTGALSAFDPAYAGGVSEELFTKLYLTIPISRKTLGQRQKINDYFVKLMEEENEEQLRAQAEAEAAAARAQAQAQAEAEAAAKAAAQAAAQAEAAAQQQTVAAQNVAQAQPAQAVAEAAPQQVEAEPVKAAVVEKPKPKKPKTKKFGRQLTDDDW